jgi:adenylate cyclase
MATDAAAPAFAATGLKERLRSRAGRSLAAQEEAGRLLALKGRTVALAAVTVLIALINPYPSLFYYEGLVALFVLLGFVGFWLRRAGLHRWWHDYVLIALDSCLLSFTIVYPNPLIPFEYPPQIGLRFGNFAYFYILLASLAIGFEPRRVLWGGLMGALAWAAGVAWIVSLPDTITSLPDRGDLVAEFAAPTFVDITPVVRDIGVFLIVVGLMALIVSRSRRLVEHQSLLERERSNLARYFPPATVDRLATQDQPLAQIREQDAAVLFFDLVGFTHWAERHSPAEVIRLLRNVHARVESAVFAHDGTLDKFIGDGAMATFGAVEPGPREATNALACAVAIAEEFSAWNAERIRTRRAPVRISIGLHYGLVVVGDIGTDRRLEFAVLGDAVNVASRLEELTRQLDCTVVVSGAVASAAREETGEEAAALLARFREAGSWGLRGREEAVAVLAYG